MTMTARALAPDRSETRFADHKPRLSRAQALVEANRCLQCADAPCTTACPTGIDVPSFIRKIATDNVKGAARTIMSQNILGMSCARVCPVEVLCAGACVFHQREEAPIAIGRLQRYATDPAVEQNWRFFTAGPSTGKRVALIGGGPAALACAHELRIHGHACTIFEKSDVLGGLNTMGVAPYKMRADDAVREVEWLLGIGGIEVKTRTEVGRDIHLEELERSHDAIFLGAGLGPDRWLNAPGESLPGVVGALSFIERIKREKLDVSHVKHAVVVGGGNTAIDVVRELRGLGITDVTLCYRGTDDTLSGYTHEWRGAQQEGVVGGWRLQAIGFEGEGKVERVRCAVVDENKKRIAGSYRVLPADLVAIAIGQSRLRGFVSSLPGLEVRDGCLVADDMGRTGRPKWFVGGDAKNGGREVVNAVAEGRDAARAIHAMLQGAS
jgi:dihydropyrimidine dehydrogenase (NAD+) subunit PreT